MLQFIAPYVDAANLQLYFWDIAPCKFADKTYEDLQNWKLYSTSHLFWSYYTELLFVKNKKLVGKEVSRGLW